MCNNNDDESCYFYIPELDRTIIYSKGEKNKWNIFPPIWHPAVNCVNGSYAIAKTETNLKEQLYNIVSNYKTPLNIEASVQHLRDEDKFNETNVRIIDALPDDNDVCCICLKDFNRGSLLQTFYFITCSKEFHVECRKCWEDSYNIKSSRCSQCNLLDKQSELSNKII